MEDLIDSINLEEEQEKKKSRNKDIKKEQVDKFCENCQFWEGKDVLYAPCNKIETINAIRVDNEEIMEFHKKFCCINFQKIKSN